MTKIMPAPKNAILQSCQQRAFPTRFLLPFLRGAGLDDGGLGVDHLPDGFLLFFLFHFPHLGHSLPAGSGKYPRNQAAASAS